MTGFQPLATGIAEHESALERDFVTLTSFQDPGATITSQPVTIAFADGHRRRRYTPDFLVRGSDQRTVLVEIKYRVDLHENWSRLRPAFIAARTWAHEHGARFRIATDRSIRGPVLENAKRLLPLRHSPVDAELAGQVLRLSRTADVVTFGSVLATLPVSRSVALATMWRLIARGELHVDLSAPITLNTIVSAS